MAEKQIQNLLKLVAQNPGVIGNVKDAATNFMGGSSSSPSVGIQQPLKELGSVENVKSSIEGLSYLNNVQYIIIGFLVIWSISMIVSRFLIKDEETKKDLEFVHNNLFGQIGIIPIIISIWVSILLIVTVVPMLLNVFPKVGGLADSFKNGITEIIKILPKLIT